MDVLITVDVEHGGSGYAREHPDVRLPPTTIDCLVEGRPFGLPFIVDTLEANGLTATFFIEPLSVHYYGQGSLERALTLLRGKGMDVQLHVHPAWLQFADNHERPDTLFSFSVAEQENIIRAGQRILEGHGCPVDAFRAGGFSANNDTYRALSTLGFTCSSSYNLSYLHDGCQIRTSTARNAPFELAGLLELPITNFLIRDLRHGLRHVQKHFQVGTISGARAKAILEQSHGLGLSCVNILLHNFEFVRRERPDWFLGPFRTHDAVVATFREMCSFLARNRDRFQITTVRQVGAAWRKEGVSAPGSELLLPKVGGVYWPL